MQAAKARLTTNLTSKDGAVTILAGTTVTVIPMGQPTDHYYCLLTPMGTHIDWVRIESKEEEAKRLRNAEYDLGYNPWEE